MSTIPPELRYAKTHEWIRVDGDTATLGITDHAQHELTDVVFVELPAHGRVLEAGDPCAVVESVKTASDVYTPVSGQVVATNPAVLSNPGLVNTSPYNEGWFIKIRLSRPAEVDSLLTAAAYQKQIG